MPLSTPFQPFLQCYLSDGAFKHGLRSVFSIFQYAYSSCCALRVVVCSTVHLCTELCVFDHHQLWSTGVLTGNDTAQIYNHTSVHSALWQPPAWPPVAGGCRCVLRATAGELQQEVQSSASHSGP